MIVSGRSLCACRALPVVITLSARLEASIVMPIWATRGPKVIRWRPEYEAGFGHVIVVDPVIP